MVRNTGTDTDMDTDMDTVENDPNPIQPGVILRMID